VPAPPVSPLRIGPRGFTGLIGWTFFDPANLISVALLLLSAGLCVYALHARDASDWYMPIGLYACLAAFLRGYFFQYYHGGRFGRVIVLGLLLFGLVAAALLWEDRARPYRIREGEQFVRVEGAPPFHWAALLHGVVGVALLIHAVLPRRWLVRATDEMADRADMDTAPDAPLATISDPVERERRERETGETPLPGG
jgi:hypothetical protein